MNRNIKVTLNYTNACRTNTSRAIIGNHYDIRKLVTISGANFDTLIKDIQFCAENKSDKEVVNCITRFAESLLSAYEIQSGTY